jgi:hypothetical protein
MGNVSRGFEYGYGAYFGNIAAAPTPFAPEVVKGKTE